jgi:excinuclease UvrABC helicase subunit UvrB
MIEETNHAECFLGIEYNKEHNISPQTIKNYRRDIYTSIADVRRKEEKGAFSLSGIAGANPEIHE